MLLHQRDNSRHFPIFCKGDNNLLNYVERKKWPVFLLAIYCSHTTLARKQTADIYESADTDTNYGRNMDTRNHHLHLSMSLSSRIKIMGGI